MAAFSGASFARSAFEAIRRDIAIRWALAFPSTERSVSQEYRHVITVTGRGRKRGHDPATALEENIRLIRKLAALRNDDGELKHPRLGQVAIVDGTRRFAPIIQTGPLSIEHLAALRRGGMEMVEPSVYEHAGQRDFVNGWKVHKLVDQSTGLVLVWVVTAARNKAPNDERTVLLERLLPALFALWPDCPLHTLIGDAGYESEEVCRDLEVRWSIHPVFARPTPRTRLLEKRGKVIRKKDGVPSCKCNQPMVYVRREGFYELARRQADGLRRGESPPPEKVNKARIRWRCPVDFPGHDPVDLWLKDDPCDHTYYPRDGVSRPGTRRRALERYRNPVESVFAGMSVRGIGTEDLRCLWSRDDGFRWLVALYCLLATARRLAHETGRYTRFHDEYLRLGLDRADQLPRRADLEDARSLRAPDEIWSWDPPARANGRIVLADQGLNAA